MKIDKTPLALAIGLVMTASLLGCASGGGSKSAGQDDGSPGGDASGSPDGASYSSARTYYPPDDQLEEAVQVGVADSGFRITHDALAPYLLATYNLHDPDDSDVTGNAAHGTAVASLAAGDEGKAALRLAKLTGSGAAPRERIFYSVGVLADEGSRVINHSYEGRLEAPAPGDSYEGVNLRDSLERIVGANDGLGSVYVVAAGNGGQALHAEAPIHELTEVFDRMLIVGGSADDGSRLDEDSNYPGGNTRWQSRFLTAPWRAEVADTQSDSHYATWAGTSIAAPQVSAHAATIIHRWPHMDAAEVSQLLLDTAGRDSSLYDSDTCGSSGTLNCGYYYLGQGEVDVEAALQPQGKLSAPAGEQVEGPSQPVADSSAQLSGAYGDSLASGGALDDMAAFDALGRDYRVDLGAHVQHGGDPERAMRRRLERLVFAPTMPQVLEEDGVATGRFRFSSRLDDQGGLLASRLDGHFGAHRISAFRFDGEARDPSGVFADAGLMPMLSLQGGTPLTRELASVSGFAGELALSDRLTLISRYWQGRPEAGWGDDYRAERADLALSLGLTEALSLTAGVGRVQEDHGLLGARGEGALAFGDDGETRLGRVQFDLELGERLGAFAFYERGHGEMRGEGLIRDVRDLRSEEMALGLQWTGARQRVAFVLRQPLRLDEGTATLSVPVGRTLDGEVIRERREAELATSGRQRDIELGYALKATPDTRLGLNLLYSLDPGHVASVDDELAGVLSLTRRF